MYKRKPAFAGSFYPSDSNELKMEVDGFLKNSLKEPFEINGEIFGIIAPHAGYVYSGQVAAYSYRYLQRNKSDVYIVIAPSHRAAFQGASVIPEGKYLTPLGEMDIDSDIAASLLESHNFDYLSEIHENEHSLEVQVPFLQHVSDGATIVPVIVGTSDLSVTGALGQSIADVVLKSEKKITIVVSTDLSHYHKYEEAVSMDNELIESIETYDKKNLVEKIVTRKCEACGIAALLVGMTACTKLGAENIKIVKYANSGDVSEDKSRVVGYMAGVIYGK